MPVPSRSAVAGSARPAARCALALAFGAVLGLTLAAGAAGALEKPLPATIVGHAVLPAGTFLTPPADASPFLAGHGRHAGPDGRRVDKPGTIPVASGLNLPLAGQAVQGLSSLRPGPDGSWWALSDNGLGSKGNSPDSMLMLHRVVPDWKAGTVAVVQTLFLGDPDRRFPWPLVLEGAGARYLTGGDMDPESLVVAEDGFWLGEEFGPWLLRFDRQGRLIGLWETVVDGKPVRSPDHPAVRLPGAPDGRAPVDIARSRGFEGMHASADGRYLHALLEGPVWRDNAPETFADGKPRLRLLEFDTAGRDGPDGPAAWTGRDWTYTLEHDGHAIGEFTWLDADRALVLERDSGEGDVAAACAEGAAPPTGAAGSAGAAGAAGAIPPCHARPARFKRLYLVTKAAVKDGGALRKLGYIDLLSIQDPDGVARRGSADGVFTFPFVTPESVHPVGDGRVVIVNDNNLPFGTGRTPGRPDDSEFILLSVPELLALQ
ncbi:MAG: hypothetical protein RLY86_1053 [Pseudomonadota bacterium]|jgi:hypothetical protein